MAYVKNTWVDQAGQIRYEQTTDEDDLIILTPNYELITEIGTPVNATNMNHIEDGIADCDTAIGQKVSKSGDTMTGNLNFSNSGQNTISLNGISTSSYADITYKDGSNNRLAHLRAYNDSSTKRRVELVVMNDNGSPAGNGVRVTYENGTESCEFPTSKCVDGQWVDSFHSLTTVVDIGNYEIDLSSYLPSDSYSYEVMVCFAGFRGGGTTNSVVSVSDASVTLTDSRDIANHAVYGVTEFDGDHKETGEFSCIVVVGSSRKFYFNIARFKLGASSLIMTKYRRIGTNS